MQFTLIAAFAFAVVAAAATPSVDTQVKSACARSRGIAPSAKAKVQRKFNGNDITPKIVPKFIPSSKVDVVYPKAAAHLGNELALSDTKKKPVIEFTAEFNFPATATNYTILMFDPDAPGPKRPTLRSILHMLKYDERPTCIKSPHANAKTSASYISPAPPSIAVHRYIFLVMRQPKGKFVPKLPMRVRQSRQHLHVKKFIAQNNLTVVGGNFFVSGANS